MASADAPGLLMRDRVSKLSTQRAAWLKQVQELSRAEAAAIALRKTASTHMGEVAAIEPNPVVKGALSAYATALQSSAGLLEGLVAEHVEKRVQLPLQAYEKNSISAMNAVFSDRDAAFVDARKAVEAHNAGRLKNVAGTKLSESETKSLTARRRAHNTHVLFEENSQLFEYKRVADMKKWLQHLIMSEIAYHTSCIEGLTQALQVVGQIDPDAAMDTLREQLVHPSISTEALMMAASAESAPLSGMYVPPDLQSAASAVFGGLNPAAAVAIAGTAGTLSSTPMTLPTGAVSTFVPENSPGSIQSGTPQGDSESPAIDVRQSSARRRSSSEIPPGAIHALSSMPAPRPTSAHATVPSPRASEPQQQQTTVTAAPKSMFNVAKLIGLGSRSKSPAASQSPKIAGRADQTSTTYTAAPGPIISDPIT